MAKAKAINANSKPKQKPKTIPANVGNATGGANLGNAGTDANNDKDVESPIPVPSPKEKGEEKESSPIPSVDMKPYETAYPDAKYFLIADDGQVFLPVNEQDAKNHQKSLDDKKELITYFP